MEVSCAPAVLKATTMPKKLPAIENQIARATKPPHSNKKRQRPYASKTHNSEPIRWKGWFKFSEQ
jgi:hypothetical protein